MFPIPSLTAKRLRAHGTILALCLWTVYLWNISAPGLLDRVHNLKGTDFLHFYTLGGLALAHRGADLYNMQAQSELAWQRVPAAAGIRYLPTYPPQVSLFFAPFARLSYSSALILWLSLSAILYGACCYSIWRTCRDLWEYKSTVPILALAFPAFWHLIAWGQTSALALACFSLAFFALRIKNHFLAGLAFGFLIFKPQLALAGTLVFLFSLDWALIAGAVISAAAQLSVAFFYYGYAPFIEWKRVLLNTPKLFPLLEPRPYQTHCLRTFWTMLVPWTSVSHALYLITALSILALTIACWKSRAPLPLRYSALLLASVLLAPHLTVYDLVILAPAFLLMAEWLTAHSEHPSARRLAFLLYLAFVLPLLGPLACWTHFQLSVPVMACWCMRYGDLAGKSLKVQLTATRSECEIVN
jgi:hypothetical protein